MINPFKMFVLGLAFIFVCSVGGILFSAVIMAILA